MEEELGGADVAAAVCYCRGTDIFFKLCIDILILPSFFVISGLPLTKSNLYDSHALLLLVAVQAQCATFLDI